VEDGATWQMPPASPGLNRVLHCFLGEEATIDGTKVGKDVGARLRSDAASTITATGGPVEFLLQQGRPIGAPVFQLGPFVMNSPEELRQAVADYHATGFGGWPWQGPDPVHQRTDGRFALHADGTIEHREMQATRP
jgi:redox-sensitive bicupin YhaK (pirin superfamily)